jgi:NAD+ synthase (glutamine-hydrolysing)
VRVALAQVNPVVGDMAGNVGRMRSALEAVRPAHPDLVVFPELSLPGYPPRDLLARQWFIDRCEQAMADVRALSRDFAGTGIVIGTVLRTGRSTGKGLWNAAVLVVDGQELHRQAKSLLPTYDVFDEARYFDPADKVAAVDFKGQRVGLTVCEDSWNLPELWRQRPYTQDPVAELARQGAGLVVNIAASPFTVGKENTRWRLMARHARSHGVPVVFVNQVGGNDDLVFDGRSMAFDAQGRLQLLMPAFAEGTAVVETTAPGSDRDGPEADEVELVHKALVLGVRDYVRKCGFARVVLGLSGGIDSAVTCCIAVAALGPENVLGVTMPSEYSSEGSIKDSRRLAERLGIEFRAIPIGAVYHQYLATLGAELGGREPGVTEENIQARVRGNILMALSNETGRLVLTTGNKSELAVGYCTLYGDMSGGLCVLADVPKTMVYRLARHINRTSEVIPEPTMSKAPSAELRPNQTDQDTLPPYETLDGIIERYVDREESMEQIVGAGFERSTVEWAVRAINRNEYKRQQAATGIKIANRAFGAGWRMPIAARY